MRPRDLFDSRCESPGVVEQQSRHSASISLSMHQYTASLPPSSLYLPSPAALTSSRNVTWSPGSVIPAVGNGTASWAAHRAGDAQLRQRPRDWPRDDSGEESQYAYEQGDCGKMAANRQQRRGGYQACVVSGVCCVNQKRSLLYNKLTC